MWACHEQWERAVSQEQWEWSIKQWADCVSVWWELSGAAAIHADAYFFVSQVVKFDGSDRMCGGAHPASASYSCYGMEEEESGATTTGGSKCGSTPVTITSLQIDATPTWLETVTLSNCTVQINAPPRSEPSIQMGRENVGAVDEEHGQPNTGAGIDRIRFEHIQTLNQKKMKKWKIFFF